MAASGADERTPILDTSREPNIARDGKQVEKKAGLEAHVTRRVTVEPVLTCFVMSQICFSQLYPQYIYARLYESYNVSAPSTNKSCTFDDPDQNETNPVYDAIEADMAMYVMANAICNILPTVIILLFIGQYSDAKGRTIFMKVALLGSLLMFIFLSLLITFSWPIELIFVAIVLAGLVGGGGVLPVLCFSYMSDITTHAQRTARFVILDVCMSCGNLVGQLGTGYMIRYLGFESVTIAFSVVIAILLSYTMFLPESIRKKQTHKLCKCDNIKDMIMLYITDDHTRISRKLCIIVGVCGMLSLAEFGLLAVTTYFFLDPPFCWISDDIGIYNASFFAAKLVGAVLVTKCLVGRIRDTILIPLCVLSMAGYYIIMSLSSSTLMVYLAIIVGVLSMAAGALLRSFASKLLPAHKQGTLFSGLMIVQMVFVMVGSLVFTPIYAVSAQSFHGLVFLVAGVLLVLAAVLASVLACFPAIESATQRREQIGADENDIRT